jgi:hypothetical protein
VSARLVVPIVEGHGEVTALPPLLHRLAAEARRPLRVNPPIRVRATAFLRPDHADFRRYLALAGSKAAGQGLVLLVFDCEDASPAQLGPDLLAGARAVIPEAPLLVALAYREFETWFIAAARSLQKAGFLTGEVAVPAAVETIRDAKGWLGQRMEHGYDPIAHQHAMARVFDLDAAGRVASFARFRRRIAAWLDAPPTPPPPAPSPPPAPRSPRRGR